VQVFGYSFCRANARSVWSESEKLLAVGGPGADELFGTTVVTLRRALRLALSAGSDIVAFYI